MNHFVSKYMRVIAAESTYFLSLVFFRSSRRIEGQVKYFIGIPCSSILRNERGILISYLAKERILINLKAANQLSYLFFALFLLSTAPLTATVSMRGKTSSIQVASGATFNITNPIASFNGTLLKSVGATVSGSPITFSNNISQAVNAINNNVSDFQGVLKQLTSVQNYSDTYTGIFLRTYDTQTIHINGTTEFTSDMLPGAYQTVVLEFPQYFDSNHIPELIFNDVGAVELPNGSRLSAKLIGSDNLSTTW